MRARKVNYLLRITFWPSVVGSAGWAVLLAAVWLDGKGDATLIWLIAGWLLLPFLANATARRFANSSRGALAVNWVLNFVFALTLPAISFQPIPTVTFLTCGITNGVIIGGPAQLVRLLLGVAIAGGIGGALTGFVVRTDSGPFTIVWSAICILVVPCLTALATWKYAVLLRQARAKLEKASLTDDLTGLRNRRFVGQVIREDCAAAIRARASNGEGGDLLFLLLDLDHFKQVNDTHGHDAGDRVLVELARRLSRLVRGSDYAVRWGGEEFLVILRSNHRAHAPAFARRVLDAVREAPFEIGISMAVEMSCSIGWAPFPFVPNDPRGFTWEDVVAWADRGLYLAKRGGRGSSVGILANGGDTATLREGLRSDERFEELTRAGQLIVEHSPGDE